MVKWAFYLEVGLFSTHVSYRSNNWKRCISKTVHREHVHFLILVQSHLHDEVDCRCSSLAAIDTLVVKVESVPPLAILLSNALAALI